MSPAKQVNQRSLPTVEFLKETNWLVKSKAGQKVKIAANEQAEAVCQSFTLLKFSETPVFAGQVEVDNEIAIRDYNCQ